MAQSVLSDQKFAQFLESYDGITRKSICSTGDAACLKICDRVFDAIRSKKRIFQIHQLALEAREYLWEVLHSKCWREIDPICRDAFGLIMLVAATTYTSEDREHNVINGSHERNSHERNSHERNQITLADSGILLGSELYRDKLQQLIAVLSEIMTNARKRKTSSTDTQQPTERLKGGSLKLKYSKLEIDPENDPINSIAPERNKNIDTAINLSVFLNPASEISGRRSLINRKETPDLVYFYEKCLQASRPVVLTGCMHDWPALERWRDPGYYIKGALRGRCCFDIAMYYLVIGQRL